MNNIEKAALDKLIKNHSIDEEDLWHNGFCKITPIHLIDSVKTAQNEISYSNYDCANLDRLLTLALRYCKEHDIPFGEHIPETLKLI